MSDKAKDIAARAGTRAGPQPTDKQVRDAELRAFGQELADGYMKWCDANKRDPWDFSSSLREFLTTPEAKS